MPKPRSRKRRRIIISAALVVLLVLALGVCAALNPKPTLTLSPTTVVAGESVVVRATHIPANQVGEIHLQSQLHTFPFRAGANGDVVAHIAVPGDEGIGNHMVSICWNGTCHASATLRVVSSVTLTSPTPSATPGASPTSTAHPTPGTTPTAYPTSTPRSSPTSPPTNLPTPKPTPPPSPTPTLPPKFIDVPAISTLGGFNVTFRYFGGGTWAVSVVVQGGTTYPTNPTTATVPNGSTYYTQHFNTPTGVKLGQTAHVEVCNGACYDSANVTVKP